MKKEKKFDCWSCKYKGSVPGSCHISCEHPSLQEVKNNSRMALLAIFASVGRAPPIVVNSKELNIKGDERGITNGWFNFPFNFDPVWLKNCDGYKKVKE